jgi:hypothetical protein
MDLLTSKENIIQEINNIVNSYQDNVSQSDEKIKEITKDISLTHKMNQKLLKEIEGKDKMLSLSEKKCYDYEIMINKIQDDANKEMDEKTKYDMIRAKDKEIFNREKEIKKLQKQVDELTKQVLESSDSNGSDEEKKAYYENLWKTESRNSLIDDPEKVNIAVEGYKNHTNLTDATEKCVGLSSMGINGWYHDTITENSKTLDKETLVEKMKEVNQQQTVKDELENPVVTEVVEDVEDSGETTEELSDVEDKTDDNLEQSSEEEITVTSIKHYGKEYYIIVGENPQYIYAIEDGELGKEAGILKNGKKNMYKK